MSLHHDLLDQAKHLLTKEPRRPKQASLRRAVSSAYYALFHLLINAGSRFVVSGPARSHLRLAVARAYDHGEMKQAATSFANGSVPRYLQAATPGVVPPQIKRVAAAFIDLQQARHEADYNLARSFTRIDAATLVRQAEQAFTDWATIKSDPASDVFLVALLLNKKLQR